MQAVLTIVLLAATPAVAQLPLSAPAPSGPEQPSQPLSAVQRPSNDAFSGSGLVEKPVPGTLKLSILDAIDRGLHHNLGLLLSQEQTDSARAQHRQVLSALLPNVTGNVSESINQINLAEFGIPLPAGLASPVVGPLASSTCMAA